MAGYGQGHDLSALRDIWADPEIELAIICAETNRHEELVKAAAAAQEHMFVESHWVWAQTMPMHSKSD